MSSLINIKSLNMIRKKITSVYFLISNRGKFNMKIITLFFSALILCIGVISNTNAQEFKWQEHHLKSGIKCNSCHGNDTSATISNETCLECHNSYTQLAEQTQDMHINVHKSPHFKDLECTSCHTSHNETTAFCQDCHGPIERDAKFSKINK